ncbi:hypothetical protein RCH09_000964 [Actimicrobium sp. GrIS 1.19]|uniref:hypothetical protein n=1 Tax=Actimicrobium sp. GrIS 1.19 TaxID=3071708 RepID=UPI002E040F31|nr:hypothetical protein [Actimicrobium sp. GrIS 1.19]
MKSAYCDALPELDAQTAHPSGELANRRPVATRFGPMVDVRNRGALRPAIRATQRTTAPEDPAIVRIWNGEKCRELSILEARALAAQLIDAAAHAERENGH